MAVMSKMLIFSRYLIGKTLVDVYKKKVKKKVRGNYYPMSVKLKVLKTGS